MSLEKAAAIRAMKGRTRVAVLTAYDFAMAKMLHPGGQPGHLPFRTRHDPASFLPRCGCAPFGEGADGSGKAMAAINVRCLDGVEVSGLRVVPFDGRSL
jgi:hypothetical protein